MNQEPTITLSIKEVGERPNSTYLFYILLDGTPLASNQSLSLQDSQAVRELSRQFGALFEQKCRPEMNVDAQRALGKQLFELWLATSWEKIVQAVPVGALRFLVIGSEVPEILNLPWELLLPPEGEILGINPLFRIRRYPNSTKQMAAFSGELRSRPLRLLFMACSPSDQPTLDYEKEEEALFRAIYGQDVAFDSCDLGTFEELKEKVSEFKPHIVHLTGHGAVLDGAGHFAFEKEDGTADLVPSEELRRLLAGSGVQCVFVSGCQSGQAPREVLNGICQSLVGAEVPLALGWAASIADDLATNFARTFYKTLKDAQPVDRALLLARQEAWKACRERCDPSWTLPVIYSATKQLQIFDPSKPPEALTRQNMVSDALPGMKEGYAEHFVGRRREQQRLLPALRRGDLQVLIITGMGGSGKSTLATRLARRLETDGFVPIPIPSSRENPLNSARLLQALGDAFRKAGRKHKAQGNAQKGDELAFLADDLNNANQTVESRLHDSVAALNEGRFLLLLDNFETNLDEEDRHILDAGISGFYKHLLESLSGGSRVIITTRYPPSDVQVLPSGIHREDLGDFPESSFLKIMQRDPEVERRSRSGELPMALLRELYRKFGGTPRFLLQIREAIKEMDAKSLEAELARVELPAGTEPGKLERLQDKYFGEIFAERIYGYLSPESQKALCQAAVYNVPVNLDAFAAVAEVPLDRIQSFAHSWQDRTFVCRVNWKSNGPLWIVYSLMRNWLLHHLSPQAKKEAHRRAGDYMRHMESHEKESDLNINWVDCLLESRFQYIKAENFKQAQYVNNRISNFLCRVGLYVPLLSLNFEMINYWKDPMAMNWIGQSYGHQCDYEKAREWCMKALDSADGSSKDAADALNNLGVIDLKQGRKDDANDKFSRALEIRQRIKCGGGTATLLRNLASIDLEENKTKEAKEKLLKSMEIEVLSGNRGAQAATLENLAIVEFKEDNLLEARKKALEALDIVKQTMDKEIMASTLSLLAIIDLNLGNYSEAEELGLTGLKLAQEIMAKEHEARIWYILGIIAVKFGRLTQGIRLVAIGYLMRNFIRDDVAQNILMALNGIAFELKYSQQQFDAIILEAFKAYQKDHGQGLIDAAFPKG